MKKKILIAMSLAMIMMTSACGGNSSTTEPTSAPTTEPTEAPTKAPTEAPTLSPIEQYKKDPSSVIDLNSFNLWDERDSNQPRAEKNYENKLAKCKGEVLSVADVVSIEYCNSYMLVYLPYNIRIDLDKGDIIEVVGTLEISGSMKDAALISVK